jgi:hypothetical protein
MKYTEYEVDLKNKDNEMERLLKIKVFDDGVVFVKEQSDKIVLTKNIINLETVVL